MANCQHPTGLCADCGLLEWDSRGHYTDAAPPALLPDGRHSFRPAVCGLPLYAAVGADGNRAGPWRCPEHGDETP